MSLNEMQTRMRELKEGLMLIGPWLTTWEDWCKLERLNKAIREWCHSEDTAICLFGLWRERTMSLSEMRRMHNYSTAFLAIEKYFDNPIPFLGGSDIYRGVTDVEGIRGSLYRSLLELSELEEKVVGNAFRKDSRIRRDPLPIMGSNQWLLIDWDNIIDSQSNCIPPYYCLKFAVPKGLKVVLARSYPVRGSLRGRIKRTCKAVGRAAALGMSGLILYDHSRSIVVQVLDSFVCALQEQKEGEFESPLEILSIPIAGEGFKSNEAIAMRLRDVLRSLGHQFVLGKLRSLKYLNMGCVTSENDANGFGLMKVPYGCPNLQVLELGWHSGLENPLKFQWPDNVCGPHNCLDFSDIDPFPVGKAFPRVTGIHGDLESFDSKRFVTFMKKGLFPSLRVLMCNGQMLEKGMAGALAISCPALRFLQIDMSDLGTNGHADWCDLLKRLFVLVMNCFKRPQTIFETGSCPECCELRVLTIVYKDLCKDWYHDLLLWLEELLNIIDICLPKLASLNVIFVKTYHNSSTEVERRGNLKYRFRQKSVDLRFCLFR